MFYFTKCALSYLDKWSSLKRKLTRKALKENAKSAQFAEKTEHFAGESL